MAGSWVISPDKGFGLGSRALQKKCGNWAPQPVSRVDAFRDSCLPLQVGSRGYQGDVLHGTSFELSVNAYAVLRRI